MSSFSTPTGHGKFQLPGQVSLAIERSGNALPDEWFGYFRKSRRSNGAKMMVWVSFDIYEDGKFDDHLMADWIRQASELPGWEP